jgi:GDPmannose 4,6-dehydratase
MWLMLQQNKPDDYILSTNETHTVREFVEECAKVLGLNIKWKGKGINEVGINQDTGDVIIEIDHVGLFRPAEVDLLIGDYSKAKKILKWKPEVTFKELVRIMTVHDLELESKNK